jgi:hypothetical protein
MTPPAEHARIAAVTLTIVLAASALAHGVTCLTPQCVAAGAIVQGVDAAAVSEQTALGGLHDPEIL